MKTLSFSEITSGSFKQVSLETLEIWIIFRSPKRMYHSKMNFHFLNMNKNTLQPNVSFQNEFLNSRNGIFFGGQM